MDDNNKKKSSKWMVIIIIILILSFIGTFIESQYEKDSKSFWNKTYDEMTDGEKKAFTDYLERELDK